MGSCRCQSPRPLPGVINYLIIGAKGEPRSLATTLIGPEQAPAVEVARFVPPALEANLGDQRLRPGARRGHGRPRHSVRRHHEEPAPSHLTCGCTSQRVPPVRNGARCVRRCLVQRSR